MKAEPYTSSELVELLRQRQNGLTQEQLAKEIGVSWPLLNNILCGQRSVGNEKVLAYLAPRGKKFIKKTVWELVER